MKKEIIATSFFLLCLLNFAAAFADTPIIISSQTCFDNSTLIKNSLYIFQANGVTVGNLSISKPATCSFGCDSTTQDCSPNPFQSVLVGIGIFCFLVVVAFFVYKKVK